jgi:GntP family gluconate:H+ symporter
LSVITAVTFVQSYFTAYTSKDEVIVVAIVVGGSVSFVVAILNRVLKLGWLSILAEQVTFVMIPPLALIFLVLGSIYLGVATPTEGGAMGAMGALIMAVWRGRLPMMQLKKALNSTARLTAFVLFILIGARIFSLTFYAVDGHVWVESLLTGLPGGKIGFLVVVNLIVFVMAFFLDFFEIAFIVVPLLAPVAAKLGIDPIWFGILLAVNMQTSFMHPPFGFALFFLRSVAPDRDFVDRVTGKATARVTTGQIYWGAVPFVVIQIIMVGLLIAFPGLASPSADDAPKIDPATVQILVPINEDDEDESSLFQAVPDETLKPTEK